jgi:C-3',4' desaturase CrtD
MVQSRPRIVVIGAGIGGLSVAASLAHSGLDVTVLEAHVYPGGCAGTFYHQGYRFDAGATMAGGFYPGGPMDRLAQATGIDQWPAHSADPVMLVHLPDGRSVPRLAGGTRREQFKEAFGEDSMRFWDWQEHTAEMLWDIAMQLPAWPPQTIGEVVRLIQNGVSSFSHRRMGRLAQLAADSLRPVSAHLHDASPHLRLFVDAQLLISAQTTSLDANALYGAAALDLPRRGVVHLEGGMGAIAAKLAQSIQQHGGRVLYRQEVERIRLECGQPVAVETRRGESFPASMVVANLTPWNVASLLGEHAPPRLRRLALRPPHGWGAFVVYAGLDGAAVPHDLPLHHQVLTSSSLGEGNSVFLSLSPAWDASRAPVARRAVTLSTHTALDDWWELFESDPTAYQARIAQYTEKIFAAAEKVIPGFRQAADLVLPGTPVTFQRFTRRAAGWVGGFPQTSLFRGWGPRLGPGMWMVGDSIFPGQSMAAVALGGLRVAGSILQEIRQIGPETQLNWAVSL